MHKTVTKRDIIPLSQEKGTLISKMLLSGISLQDPFLKKELMQCQQRYLDVKNFCPSSQDKVTLFLLAEFIQRESGVRGDVLSHGCCRST